jgi:hypothetical protein
MVFIVNSAAISGDSKVKSQLAGQDEILRTDITGDGNIDIIERYCNGKRVRWFDENGNMSASDTNGDMTGDCLQIDMDDDGFYDGSSDVTVKWVDTNKDGRADWQFYVRNPVPNQGKNTGGKAVFMAFEDVDGDGVMHYIDWRTFTLESWANQGAQFFPDYNGNSLFIKTHVAPHALKNIQYNWENPFAFYDFDDDGCSEMCIRMTDKLPPDGTINDVHIGFDIDNDSQAGNETDYDFTLYFTGGELDYSSKFHSIPGLKASDWALPYFQHQEWRTIDELSYIEHNECFEATFNTDWKTCWFVFDEDDDDHRWERVEMYQPRDPYTLRVGGLSHHIQSDILGDRGEFDSDNSGKGQLYFSPWDGRVHLYGAEWGAWTVDSNAQYHNGINAGQATSAKTPEKVGEVVHYRDTNGNGFFDLIEWDFDGDRQTDCFVSLLKYGSDERPLLDTDKAGWSGINKAFTQQAKKSWRQAYDLYAVCRARGLVDANMSEIASPASVWQKYSDGAKLKEKLFWMIDSKLRDRPEKRAVLQKYFFTADFEKLSEFVRTVEFTDFRKGDTVEFVLENPLKVSRKNELITIPFGELKGIDSASYSVKREERVLPCQLADFDFDGINDAVVFLVDLDAEETVTVRIENATANDQVSAKMTHAELSVRALLPEAMGSGKLVDEGCFISKKIMVRRGDKKSSDYRFEGPLIESDKIGYRLYWDNRGAIDAYGKTNQAFIGDAHTAKKSHHTMQPWGRDILHNGIALGAGGLGVGIDNKRFSPSSADYGEIVVGNMGPIFSSYRMIYKGIDYEGKKYDMTWDIAIWAGQHAMMHDVTITKGGKCQLLAALTNHSDMNDVTMKDALNNKGKFDYVATFGKQVFADANKKLAKKSTEKMGLGLLWERGQLKELKSSDVEFEAVFKLAEHITYYSFATYNGEKEQSIDSDEDFYSYVDRLAASKANPVIIKSGSKIISQ